MCGVTLRSAIWLLIKYFTRRLCYKNRLPESSFSIAFAFLFSRDAGLDIIKTKLSILLLKSKLLRAGHALRCGQELYYLVLKSDYVFVVCLLFFSPDSTIVMLFVLLFCCLNICIVYNLYWCGGSDLYSIKQKVVSRQLFDI